MKVAGRRASLNSLCGTLGISVDVGASSRAVAKVLRGYHNPYAAISYSDISNIMRGRHTLIDILLGEMMPEHSPQIKVGCRFQDEEREAQLEIQNIIFYATESLQTRINLIPIR